MTPGPSVKGCGMGSSTSGLPPAQPVRAFTTGSLMLRSPCGVPPVAQVMILSSSRGDRLWLLRTAGPVGSAYQGGMAPMSSISRIDSAQAIAPPSLS